MHNTFSFRPSYEAHALKDSDGPEPQLRSSLYPAMLYPCISAEFVALRSTLGANDRPTLPII